MDIETIKAKFSELNKEFGWNSQPHIEKYLASIGIEIKQTSWHNLGRCYNSMSYEMTSVDEPSPDLIKFFKDKMMLGYGQEHHIDDPVFENGKWIVRATATVDSSD